MAPIVDNRLAAAGEICFGAARKLQVVLIVQHELGPRGGVMTEHKDAAGGRDASANFFHISDEYPIMHGGAHRAAPPRLGAPALTRHLAFWRPKGESVRDLQKWRVNADRFLIAFHRRVCVCAGDVICMRDNDGARHLFRSIVENPFEVGEAIRLKSPSEQHTRRFESVTFEFEYEHVPFKVRAELHSEYFTLSIFAEMIACSAEQVLAQQQGVLAPKLAAAFDGFVRQVESDYCGGIPSPTRSQVDFQKQFRRRAAAVEPYVRELYDQFWADFDDIFMLADAAVAFDGGDDFPYADCAESEQGALASKHRIGAVFADFRGLLLKIDPDALEAAHRERTPERRKGWLASPFRVLERDCLQKYVGKPFATERMEVDLADALMSAIEAARMRIGRGDWPVEWFGGPVEGEIEPPEYTVASLSGHRALYMSALGPQRPWSTIVSPVYFIIASSNEHRWQLGRMVDRIHSLGTLRLASLKDYRDLEQAVISIRELSQRMDRYEEQSKFDGAPKRLLNEWYREFAEIGRLETGDGGLLNRIERANYYIDNFRKICQWQRFERVEGFQTYPELVERRIGALWNHYQRLANRYAQLRDRLQVIVSNTLAQEQISLLSFAEIAAGPPFAYYGAYVFKMFLISLSALLQWLAVASQNAPQVAIRFVDMVHGLETIMHSMPGVGPPLPLIAMALLFYVGFIWLRRRRQKHKPRSPGFQLRSKPGPDPSPA